MTVTNRPSLSSRALYLRILRQLRPYWKVIVLAFLATQLAAMTEPMFAWLMGPLINLNFSSQAAQHVPAFLQPLADWLPHSPAGQGVSPWLVPSLIVALFLFRAATTFFSEWAAAWLSNQLVLDLRQKMYERLLALPVSYYDTHPAGLILSRIANDVGAVTQAGISVLTVLLKDTLTIIGQLALMLYIDWRLTLICLILLPLAGFSIRKVGQRLRGLNRQQQQAFGDMMQVMEEGVHGQKVIKVFGGQRYEALRFFGRANRVRQLAVKQTVASSGNSALVQLLLSIALAVVVYYAGLRSAAGSMTAGDFMSFITAMLMLSQPVQRLSRTNESLQKGLAAAESVFGLIDEPVEVDVGQQSLVHAGGQLQFRQVCFRYPHADRDSLDAISLTVNAGETVALVGGSGSGKTTLASLLPRFHDAGAGDILLDGIPLAHLPLATLRQQIALVSQDVSLFNDTVAANIAYGCPDASEQRIREAAEAANALEFIEQLPLGMQTIIGDRGNRLSGGQKQRLAIARALLKDAPILILDEATSALDSESERKVQSALERLMQHRTTLVIAHRLSTIEAADRIVVMQQGRIVEVGPHMALLQRGGAYAALWRAQFQEGHHAT
ncbi:lipid A export permease/ATP-binding protein MsbA [Leeia aquatica]|uniref:Lipid A export permease/ATP-binding protein MsbA n=1 Tax=Leeia aquatica TaxID=2725557 RepID=A0A847SGB6_9NEIS|nr:lipid A export permease/ATP-binding protein MsbA [Leeia aquatica]NLR76446.1 lipid A export permease/ATP-binding protein MsbA [Leeia aquatica]